MKNKAFMLARLSLCLTLVLHTCLVFAQDHARPVLFNSNESMSVTLKYDISYFREHREKLREKGVKGTIEVKGKSYEVEVLSRGQGSMDNENSPYKLKFKKDKVVGSEFQQISKIKSFPNPYGATPDGEMYVLSNYLVYKLMEIYSPYHFKTRMMKVHYVDTSGKIDSFTSHAFLLEPNKEAAERYGMSYVPFEMESTEGKSTAPCDTSVVTGNIEKDILEKMSAFQFLIGNADHAIPGYFSHMFKGQALAEKNMKMLKDKDGHFYPLAYDFDLSGLIERKICFWEAGNGIFSDIREDHFNNIGPKCDPVILKKHLKEDFEEYHYKNHVIAQYSDFKVAVEKWKILYAKDLKMLSPNYLKNLEIWLATMEQVISESRE